MHSRAGVTRLPPLLAALGDPQRAVPAIHVGGTNGKGSVCAMLAAILRSAGRRVARYTSPHLESPTERLHFDGADIETRAFEAGVAEVRAAARRLDERGEVAAPFTQFDLLTATAFAWFASRKADVAIIEVGLGGQSDATNVIESPVLSILTNVSLDHTEVLGTEEEAIAREKAGIIKQGRPVLTQASGRSFRILSERAKATRSHLKRADVATYVSPLPSGQRFGYRGRMWELGLLGTYQLQNVAVVLDAVDILRAQGYGIPDEAVRQGLLEVTWPGRMEAWLDGKARWLFDGAHNPAGAHELALSVRRHFPAEEIVLVFGALRGKPGAQMVQQLAPLARTAILTAPPSERALAPADLAVGVRHADLRIVPDPVAALAEAVAAPGGKLVLVCGSLYLVGMARALARKHEA